MVFDKFYGIEVEKRPPRDPGRTCRRCPTILSRYNRGELCSVCTRVQFSEEHPPGSRALSKPPKPRPPLEPRHGKE